MTVQWRHRWHAAIDSNARASDAAAVPATALTALLQQIESNHRYQRWRYHSNTATVSISHVRQQYRQMDQLIWGQVCQCRPHRCVNAHPAALSATASLLPIKLLDVSEIGQLSWRCPRISTKKCNFPHWLHDYASPHNVAALWIDGHCLSVSLSVRHTPVLCLNTKIILIFLPSGSHIILVFFWLRAPIPNSMANPVSGGAKYTGWENSAIFEWNHRLSCKRYKISPWLLWNVNSKS